jgi:superfamily II DNA or RNA helicase
LKLAVGRRATARSLRRPAGGHLQIRLNNGNLQLGRLRPHQQEPAQKLQGILRRSNGVDLSDTGTGKTYVAAAVASALQVPTLVVAPKIARTSWHRAAEHFGDSFSFVGYEMLCTGRTLFGQWEHPLNRQEDRQFFKCQCCQQVVDLERSPGCYAHPRGIHCLETKKRDWDYGRFQWSPEVRLVIFDEAHRCAGRNSLAADTMIAARRQKITTLCLSATLASSPLELRALGFSLGLHGLGDFYTWARRNGCGTLPGLPGFRWVVGEARQREIMAGIRAQLVPARGVRVSVESIPDFPKCDITAELYDLEESPARIDELYATMADALGELEKRRAGDLSEDHPLTQLLRARQKLELLKVPILVELCKDYQAKGHSVALFVNYAQTVAELRRRLKTDCFIDGTQNSKPGLRDQCLDNFQENRRREIVVNSKAGGIAVSLHDLDGRFPRVGLVMPDFSARTVRQVFGRLPRDGAKSRSIYKLVLAAGTVERSIFSAFSRKAGNLDALNDADLIPDRLQLSAGCRGV